MALVLLLCATDSALRLPLVGITQCCPKITRIFDSTICLELKPRERAPPRGSKKSRCDGKYTSQAAFGGAPRRARALRAHARSARATAATTRAEPIGARRRRKK